jgi:hypothetical protein
MRVMIEPHRLAEERSLAYHRAVAERLHDDAVLERARARLRDWRERGIVVAYALEWEHILAMPLEALKQAILDESEAGRARRQATPFAGVLAPRERWQLWREVRERLTR